MLFGRFYRQISTWNPTSTVTSTKDLSFKHIFETRELQFPFENGENCFRKLWDLKSIAQKDKTDTFSLDSQLCTWNCKLNACPLSLSSAAQATPNFPHFNIRSSEILFCKELDTWAEYYFNINYLFWPKVAFYILKKYLDKKLFLLLTVIRSRDICQMESQPPFSFAS